MKKWLTILIILSFGLTVSCGLIPKRYSHVQWDVYKDITQKERIVKDATGKYYKARLEPKDSEMLKTWWGIDSYVELSKDEQKYILVFVDKANRKATFLDEELNTWNGVLEQGSSAFEAPRIKVVKYRLF